MKGPGSLLQGLTRSRSALGSSVVMTGLNGLSKALGYGRVVLMAVLFGASAGMDAYYVAVGAVGLLAATFQNALESAVLPHLAQPEREGRDSDLMASIFRAVILLSLPALLAMGLFARPFVRLFAYHFEAERLRLASVMILLLLPFGAVTILQGLLTAWSNHRGRYALTSVALGGVNLLYIPLIALLGTIWGVYGIALAQSLSFAAAAGLLWRLCGGLPLRLKGPLPWDLLKRAAADSLLCVGLVGAGSLYSATDRFFASALPAGSVSAISYGAIVFGLPLSFAAQPLLIYLTRSSKTEASGTSAKGQLQAALAIGWGYFVPCGAALAAASLPLLNLVLAYGAFDARAASLTASCLAALAVALPFALCRTVLYRHIQSIGKLRLFVLWSYLSVGFNIALDWYLAPPSGSARHLPGHQPHLDRHDSLFPDPPHPGPAPPAGAVRCGPDAAYPCLGPPREPLPQGDLPSLGRHRPGRGGTPGPLPEAGALHRHARLVAASRPGRTPSLPRDPPS